jgi:G3E family GTPase
MHGSGKRVAVIVNDLAQVNIDAALVKKTKTKQKYPTHHALLALVLGCTHTRARAFRLFCRADMVELSNGCMWYVHLCSVS